VDRSTSALVGLVFALWLPQTARAEPHFSARTGLRCSRCHVSPTGGGKRTPYAALYAHSSLPISWTRPHARTPSPAVPAADGAWTSWLLTTMATGEVTSWLALGADLRLSNLTTFSDERQNTFDATGGNLYLELRPWPGRVVLYVDEEVAAGGARSREAWGMIRGPWSTYLRGGWMLPPFGLRLLDDETYTRRATGANFANPDMGLELGADLGPLFAAVALTNGNFSAVDNDRHKAIYALLELNFDLGRAGISGAHNPSEEGCRTMMASFAAMRLGRVVLQGEVDLIADRPPDSSRWSYGVAGMAELDLLVTRGVGLRLGYDYHDADLDLGRDRRQRFRFGLDLFPLRMVEVKIYYMLRQTETTQPLDDADRLEVTLHVYL